MPDEHQGGAVGGRLVRGEGDKRDPGGLAANLGRRKDGRSSRHQSLPSPKR